MGKVEKEVAKRVFTQTHAVAVVIHWTLLGIRFNNNQMIKDAPCCTRGILELKNYGESLENSV